MKTKIVNKKGKKLSLNKTSSLTKSQQQQKNAIESKKGSKKAKLAISVQNGNPTLENKEQVFKIVDKQKWKQNKVKQTITVPSKTKKIKDAKEKPSLTTAESESKKDIEKKLEHLTRRQERRNLRKIKRRQNTRMSVASIKLNIKQIKDKIEEIRSREVLSKSAKRKLGVLNRKLKFEMKEKLANKSDKLDTMVKKNNEKGKHIQTDTHKIYQRDALVKSKQAHNEGKMKVKKKHLQDKKHKIKSEKNVQYDINIMKDNDDEDENDENQSSAEEELIDNVKEQIDDKSDEDGEDEEDEEDIDNEASILEVRKNKIKNKKQLASLNQQEKEGMKKKKKQHIFFVTNLPLNVTTDELKQHFQTKVGVVTNVKMDAKNSFAYVIMAGHTDFKKGLLLNDTFFKKRKITVQYLTCNMADNKLHKNKKADITKRSPVAKNKKLQALQKAGKLAEYQENQETKKLSKKKKHSRQLEA